MHGSTRTPCKVACEMCARMEGYAGDKEKKSLRQICHFLKLDESDVQD